MYGARMAARHRVAPPPTSHAEATGAPDGWRASRLTRVTGHGPLRTPGQDDCPLALADASLLYHMVQAPPTFALILMLRASAALQAFCPLPSNPPRLHVAPISMKETKMSGYGINNKIGANTTCYQTFENTPQETRGLFTAKQPALPATPATQPINA